MLQRRVSGGEDSPSAERLRDMSHVQAGHPSKESPEEGGMGWRGGDKGGHWSRCKEAGRMWAEHMVRPLLCSICFPSWLLGSCTHVSCPPSVCPGVAPSSEQVLICACHLHKLDTSPDPELG